MTEDTNANNVASTMNNLIVAVAERSDREAFQTLFAHFAPRLKSFIMHQGTNEQVAEDVVQEAMIKVWNKAAQFDPVKASASTWIFTIARNLRIDMLRKANRPEPDMNDPAMVPEPEPAAHEIIARKQEGDSLKEMMKRLSGEQQDVLRLAFFEDKTHPEVAEALGIPIGTVKSRIRLALKHIRDELGDTR